MQIALLGNFLTADTLNKKLEMEKTHGKGMPRHPSTKIIMECFCPDLFRSSLFTLEYLYDK
ncbi:hypothetical protein Pint_03490 [Pistacia integerrima]|uniref:Uncharacterized protein n=1 Tax=Pistacia integerrima TaxID=434235 RepID=A0ACC0ZIA6_9ROSI|nr:hypothetical protein Pint_03490 [Pistacia integerrima]